MRGVGGMFVGGRGKGRGHLGLSAVTHGVKWEESTESSGWEGSVCVCAVLEFLMLNSRNRGLWVKLKRE